MLTGRKPSLFWLRIAFIILLTAAYASAKASGTSTPLPSSTATKTILIPVNRPARFPGGDPALYRYLTDHLKYPREAIIRRVSGIVVLQFRITKKGDLKDIKVIRGPGYGTDEEAIRLLSEGPKWEPALQKGKPAEAQQTVSVRFNLQPEYANEAIITLIPLFPTLPDNGNLYRLLPNHRSERTEIKVKKP